MRTTEVALVALLLLAAASGPAAPPPDLLEFLDQLPMLDEYGDVLDAEMERLDPGPRPAESPEPPDDSRVR